MRRRLSIVVAAVLLAAPAAAQADPPVLHVTCNERHVTVHFDASRTRGQTVYPQLRVHHVPGWFGHVVVTDLRTEQTVWEYRQPLHWISGDFMQYGPTLPADRLYRVDYWSENVAQHPSLCYGELWFVSPPGF